MMQWTTVIKLSWLLLLLVIVSLCSSVASAVSLPKVNSRQRPASGSSSSSSNSNNEDRSRTQQPEDQPAHSRSRYNRLFQGYQQAVARASSQLENHISSAVGGDDYVCAPHCTCSTVMVMDRVGPSSRLATTEMPTNLSRVFCESNQFTDLLTIDRRTQIIHISLPASSSSSSSPPLEEKPLTVSGEQQQLFRMPRLAQFNRLREIIIIKLKFEVCDSEVFKRGQKLLRLRLNHNHLIRLSKSCIKHLEKLLELNLDHNHLSELESALFSGLSSLRTLSMAHNKLSDLAAHQFVNLSRLTTLNLVGNSFKTINLHLLEPMQTSLRVLLLAKNQIKSFTYMQQQQHQQQQSASSNFALQPLAAITNSSSSSNSNRPQPASISLMMGLVFKSLIKLNVDENKFERIKLLQLHRFYNVKYLSIRRNEIATIRDKAFNGLKLVELNLAHNQLQTISKCAFCNSTIRRLVLSNNNISLPQPPSVLQLQPQPQAQAQIQDSPVGLQPGEIAHNQDTPPSASPLLAAAESMMQTATSSQNMLILSQSIFGPLFGQLEYLDLSNNEQLAEQLESLLEPLLKLEYLNLASVGLDRSLPSPSLFKNLRQLRYLNLSHNQLDQLIAETVEPLSQLEILDLSYNKFSELDESFLVTIDEMSPLKLLNLGSNPWYCSQCKVAPLYDWILRSPIYNLTCISPLAQQRNPVDQPAAPATTEENDEADGGGGGGEEDLQQIQARNLFPLANSYAISTDNYKLDDVDLGEDQQQQQLTKSNYNLLSAAAAAAPSSSFEADPLLVRLDEDDGSIFETINLVASMSDPAQLRSINFESREYCLKCEFPSELSAFHIHELAPGDFKFCAGAAPRFAASEPKIGLTLAIVIIGALFCIIIVVIVMYRKKSNTYYTNEDMDQLDGSSRQANGKKPVFSISSDNENNQYGDGTDYSSPPMSHSIDSYSQEDEEVLDEDEEDEEYDDDDDDEDEDEDEDYEDDEFEATLEDDEDEDRGGAGAAAAAEQNRSASSSGDAAKWNNSSQSVDSHQGQTEDAKRQRKNQLEEYTKRQDKSDQPADATGQQQHTTTQPKSKPEPAPSPVESVGQASSVNTSRSTGRPETSLAGAGRQPTGKSIKSHRQQSSVDSVAAAMTAPAHDVDAKGKRQDQHQATTSILVRNQSHPQHQKLVFAEQPSIELSSPQGTTKGTIRRKDRSKDNSMSGEPATHKQLSFEDRPPEVITAAPTTRVAPREERTPAMHHIPAAADAAAAAAKTEPVRQTSELGRRQHSLGARKRDRKSGDSNDRSTLRRNQTSKEPTLNNSTSKLIQVPSQPSGSQFVQLQARDLQQQQQQQQTGSERLSPQNNNVGGGGSGKPERARQRFAVSKDASQTLGGQPVKPLWNSGDSQGGGQVAAEPRPPTGNGEKTMMGRQMAHHVADSPSTISDDATTADSLALEQANVAGSSEDEEHLGTGESMGGYSGGGGALAGMDSDTNSLFDETRQRAADERGQNNASNQNNNRLRPAVSSHSALTQTGSNDLSDC